MPPPKQSPLPKQLLGQRGVAHVGPPKPWLHLHSPFRQMPLALQVGAQAAKEQSGPEKPALHVHTTESLELPAKQGLESVALASHVAQAAQDTPSP